MRLVVALVVAAALLAATPLQPAHAQVESREGITLQNQIYQLRQELQSLENQPARGGGSGSQGPAYPPPPRQGDNDMVAQLLTRVEALSEQVRQLRGRVDETQNQMQQQNADLGKRIDDLTFQINQQGGHPGTRPNPTPSGSGGGRGPAPATLAPPAGAPSPGSPPGQARPRTPEAAMREGHAALGRHDYGNAESAARQVLANRTSPRAYDARLLLAQALYGQHQYAQAAIAFDDAYNSSRKGSHAQDALLGLANSLSAINEKKAACDTLTRLRKDFPKPRADIATGAEAAGRKTGCR